MYCKSCGKQIDDDSKFCQYCGTSLTLVKSVNFETAHTEPQQSPRSEPAETFLFQNNPDIGAVRFGLVMLIVTLIFGLNYENVQRQSDQLTFAFIGLFTLVYRFCLVKWIFDLAREKNRIPLGYVLLGFFIPNIVLIYIALLKTKRGGKLGSS